MTSMTAPLIGLSGRRWPVKALGDSMPIAMHEMEFDLHLADYPQAIAACGGLPVELTRDADVEGIVARIDGLVLTGGADVDPAVYGQEPDPDLGTIEPDRDVWELALLAAAEARDLPVLCVCRGTQLLNAAKGGTLRQHVDVKEGDGHPRFDTDGREIAHSVDVVEGSLAGSLYGGHLDVNSLHHQVIDEVGSGLVVTGRSPDGAPEVIELEGKDVLGVQWHPELLARPDPSFVWLVDAARRRLSSLV
jgi:putative glutamine amidotransferase